VVIEAVPPVLIDLPCRSRPGAEMPCSTGIAEMRRRFLASLGVFVWVFCLGEAVPQAGARP